MFAPLVWTEFSYILGPTDPCPIAVHMEPFSTSVFKVLVWIFATTTKICARGGSTQDHSQGFAAHHSGPPTLLGIHFDFSPRRLYMSPTLSVIHFQGWLIRQVSCYTLLSGFQLPWPPSCCQNEPTPFLGSGWANTLTLYPSVRFIPHRLTSLPGEAHIQPPFNIRIQLRNPKCLPI